MSTVIVDTSILTDIFVTSSPRHPEAQELWQHLQDAGVRIRVPMHAAFELWSGIESQKIQASQEGREFGSPFTEPDTFIAYFVDIDSRFFKKYWRADLPYMKAGDLIFVAMAKSDNGILITEDHGQYRKSKDFGVEVYTIREYLGWFANP